MGLSMALFLSNQSLHFPSDWRSSGCGLFQELSHQLLRVRAAPSHSSVSVELFELSCILGCVASLPSFLSCMGRENFLSNPHSCLLALPTVNFASFPFPLCVALEAMLLYFVMLKPRREAGWDLVYFPFDSVLLPCSLIFSLKFFTLFYFWVLTLVLVTHPTCCASLPPFTPPAILSLVRLTWKWLTRNVCNSGCEMRFGQSRPWPARKRGTETAGHDSTLSLKIL